MRLGKLWTVFMTAANYNCERYGVEPDAATVLAVPPAFMEIHFPTAHNQLDM